MANNVQIDILVQDQFSKNINLLNSLMKDAAVQAKVLDKELADAFDIGFRARSGNLFGLKPGTIVSSRDVAQLAAARSQTDNLTNSLRRYDNQLRTTSTSNRTASGSFNLLQGSIAGFTAAFAVRQVQQYLGEAVQLSATNQAVSSSFESLTRSYGLSGKTLLDQMKTVGSGYIHQTDLMRVANRGLLAVGEDMAKNLPRLLEISIAAAAATGEKADYVFKTLIDGISRGEPRLIDNASIYIKLGDAVDEYAKSLGKSADELDQYERRIATMNAVLAEADSFTEGLGGQNLEYARTLGEIDIALKDAKISVGDLVAELGVLDLALSVARGTSEGATGLTRFFSELKANVNESAEDGRGLSNILSDIGRAAISSSSGLSLSARAFQAAFEAARKDGASLVDITSAYKQEVFDVGLAYQEIENRVYAINRGIEHGFVGPMEQAAQAALIGAKQARFFAENLGDAAAQAYTLKDALSDAERRISGFATSLAAQRDVLSLSEVQNLYTKGADEFVNMQYMLRNADDATKAYLLGNLEDRLLQEGKMRRDAIKDQEQLEKEAARNAEQRLKSLQSTIETVLKRGLEVKPFDFALTEAGIYEDAPLENARRLQAIVERGFSELETHPDWAGILQIPADVLSGSEIQLKQWAATTNEAVSNLADPSRINWDAFLREFQKQMEFEAGQEAVIAEAMKRLTEAGLIGGFKKADVKRQLEVAVGKKDPITSALESSMSSSNIGLFASKTWGDQFAAKESTFNAIGRSVADWIFAGYKSRLDDLLKDQGADSFEENLPPPNDNASYGGAYGGPLE